MACLVEVEGVEHRLRSSRPEVEDFATGPPRISGIAPLVTCLIQASIFAAASGSLRS
jgi:hypothetical protein